MWLTTRQKVGSLGVALLLLGISILDGQRYDGIAGMLGGFVAFALFCLIPVLIYNFARRKKSFLRREMERVVGLLKWLAITMKSFPIFLAIAAVLCGIVIFVGIGAGDIIGYYVPTWMDVLVGIALIAGGLTYLWKLSGFRGLAQR